MSEPLTSRPFTDSSMLRSARPRSTTGAAGFSHGQRCAADIVDVRHTAAEQATGLPAPGTEADIRADDSFVVPWPPASCLRGSGGGGRPDAGVPGRRLPGTAVQWLPSRS